MQMSTAMQVHLPGGKILAAADQDQLRLFCRVWQLEPIADITTVLQRSGFSAHSQAALHQSLLAFQPHNADYTR